jgi:ABC-type xylose transport system permease subunit
MNVQSEGDTVEINSHLRNIKYNVLVCWCKREREREKLVVESKHLNKFVCAVTMICICSASYVVPSSYGVELFLIILGLFECEPPPPRLSSITITITTRLTTNYYQLL